MLDKDLIECPQMWQLVLEINNSGISVVAFSKYEDNTLIFEHIPFDSTAQSGLKAIENAIYDNPMLLLYFSKVTIIYVTEQCIAVPLKAVGLADLLMQRAFPVVESRQTLIAEIPAIDTAVTFAVPTDVLCFLHRTFSNVTITTPLQPLAAYFSAKHPARRKGKTLVNLNDGRLDIIVLGDEAPLQINSFTYREPMDAVYYILASREKLSLPDTDEIMIAGNTKIRAAVTPILRRYVRYVMPAIFPSAMFRAGKASLTAPFEMIIAPIAAI